MAEVDVNGPWSHSVFVVIFCSVHVRPGHHPEAVQAAEPGSALRNPPPGEEERSPPQCSEGAEATGLLLQDATHHLFQRRGGQRPRGADERVFQVQTSITVTPKLCPIQPITSHLSLILNSSRLALLELQQSSVFEGPTRRLFFTYDLKALEDGKYRQAGVLIGWSLAQGGPGPRCLHPTLYQVVLLMLLSSCGQ